MKPRRNYSLAASIWWQRVFLVALLIAEPAIGSTRCTAQALSGTYIVNSGSNEIRVDCVAASNNIECSHLGQSLFVAHTPSDGEIAAIKQANVDAKRSAIDPESCALIGCNFSELTSKSDDQDIGDSIQVVSDVPGRKFEIDAGTCAFQSVSGLENRNAHLRALHFIDRVESDGNSPYFQVVDGIVWHRVHHCSEMIQYVGFPRKQQHIMPGGEFSSVVNLACALEAKGHRVTRYRRGYSPWNWVIAVELRSGTTIELEYSLYDYGRYERVIAVQVVGADAVYEFFKSSSNENVLSSFPHKRVIARSIGDRGKPFVRALLGMVSNPLADVGIDLGIQAQGPSTPALRDALLSAIRKAQPQYAGQHGHWALYFNRPRAEGYVGLLIEDVHVHACSQSGRTQFDCTFEVKPVAVYRAFTKFGIYLEREAIDASTSWRPFPVDMKGRFRHTPDETWILEPDASLLSSLGADLDASYVRPPAPALPTNTINSRPSELECAMSGMPHWINVAAGC